jgi:hypothetical protein
MEAANVLSSSLPVVGELWGMSVNGVPMPVESYFWMDDDAVPVIRLFVGSSPVSGHEAAISFNGVVTMVVGVKVTLNEPFAVTIRYVESISV